MTKPGNIVVLTSKIDPANVMRIIMSFAQHHGYQIDDFDEASGIIILSEGATWNSYGFFFPTYIKEENGSTIIEVGAKSKVLQIGPVLSITQEKYLAGIKTALGEAAEKTIINF